MGYRSFVILTLLGMTSLFGCSGAAPLMSLGGIVFKGPVSQGVIQVYSIKKDGKLSDLLTTLKTGPQGQFLLASPLVDFPLYLKVIEGIFVDEATGKTIPLTQEAYLSSVMLEPSANIVNAMHITPLTSLASHLILMLVVGGEDMKSAYDYVNKKFSDSLGISDFYTILPADLTDKQTDSAQSQNALYGLWIAGLSEQAKSMSLLKNDDSITVLDLVSALRKDISDGTFDGKEGGILIEIGAKRVPLSPLAMNQKMALGMADFLENSRNKSGLKEADVKEMMDKMNQMPPIMVGIDVTPSIDSMIIGLDAEKIFTAKVTGISNGAMVWSVQGPGRITSEGKYFPPNLISSSEEKVIIRATSQSMPTLYGESKLTLKEAISLSPISSTMQIETQRLLLAKTILEDKSLEWFVNDIPGGNSQVGTLQKISDLEALYTAPLVLPHPSKVVIKVKSVSNPNVQTTADISLFETKVSAQYDGFLYDLVSNSEEEKPGDGLDALFKLDFDNEGTFTETITSFSLKDAKGTVLWDTIANNGSYLLGISEKEGASLIPFPISINPKKTLYLSASDFNDDIVSGGDFKFHILLASGRTIVVPFSLKESLMVDEELHFAGVQPSYSFIRVESLGYIKAMGLTPLELISEGNMVILGKVSANGGNGKNGGKKAGIGGEGGPGSSLGGTGGRGTGEIGKGEGGGENLSSGKELSGGGGGGFGSIGENASNQLGGGKIYGNEELNPLVGGSGGAGGRNSKDDDIEDSLGGGGGGGGGGAIRLTAARNITISGIVEVNGGNGGSGAAKRNKFASGGGGGSGGGIFLQSQSGRILVSPTGKIIAIGGSAGNLAGKGGKGRIHTEGQLINQGIIDPE